MAAVGSAHAIEREAVQLSTPVTSIASGNNVQIFGYTIPEEVNRLVLGLVLVLVALFAPRGIVGLIHGTRQRRLGV